MRSAGCRRLCALIFQLPAESALAHAAGQDWTTRDEIAAAALELDHARWLQFRAMNGDKSVRQEKPLRVPRPGQPPPVRKVTMSELIGGGDT